MLNAMKRIALVCMLFVITACATKAPVQEMSEARSAIAAAKSIVSDDGAAIKSLMSAEQALEEAAKAIENERFERARRLALDAKRKAQQAVQHKKGDK